MVGIYGTIKTSDEFDQAQEHFFFTGKEYSTKYKDNNRSIHATFHNKKEAKSQPVENNGVHLFIWGEICGHGNLNDYESRKDIEEELTDVEYCAKLYEKYGLKFVKKLNSNFAGVIFDNESSKTHLFTDRLGSRPLYYTKSPNDSLIFSTSLQAVASHSNYDIRFEKEFLCQYLTIYRVLGLDTPLKDIRKIHPGSILTFDHETGKIKKRVYWRPKYKPLDKDFQYFVDWFSKIFDEVMYDRLDKNKDYGLMLSGGTDSRIIADYLEGETAFHMNETMNREAKIARKVAKVTKNKFEFLKREKEYVPNSLQIVTPLMNFNNYFKAAHSIGFSEELQNVDVIVSGHYADTVLLALYVPKIKLELPFFYPVELLFENIIMRKINSTEDLLQHINKPNPQYVTSYFKLDKYISKNNKESDRRCQLNKVFFQGLDTMINFWPIYPITNTKGILIYESLNQMSNTCYPYLDNRIIELSQYLPTKYKIKRDIVKNSLHQKNTRLSKIIEPKSLQPTYRHEFVHSLFQSLHYMLDNFKHHMEGEGSWPNHIEIMKETRYAEKNIKENKEIFDKFDYLDYKKALAQIKNVEDHYNSVLQIQSLLSFLEIYKNISSK